MRVYQYLARFKKQSRKRRRRGREKKMSIHLFLYRRGFAEEKTKRLNRVKVAHWPAVIDSKSAPTHQDCSMVFINPATYAHF